MAVLGAEGSLLNRRVRHCVLSWPGLAWWFRECAREIKRRAARITACLWKNVTPRNRMRTLRDFLVGTAGLDSSGPAHST